MVCLQMVGVTPLSDSGYAFPTGKQMGLQSVQLPFGGDLVLNRQPEGKAVHEPQMGIKYVLGTSILRRQPGVPGASYLSRLLLRGIPSLEIRIRTHGPVCSLLA